MNMLGCKERCEGRSFLFEYVIDWSVSWVVFRAVGRFVGWLVFYNFLKEQKEHLDFSIGMLVFSYTPYFS